jgi:oxygen-independent coproporphyrinogen-3 oxidase
MGVQSLNKKTLLRIARLHDKDLIKSSISIIKQSKINNFGIDLIMGLPHQSINDFKNDLKNFVKFGTPHISLYFLSYDTPKIDIFIKDCPTEFDQIKMYEFACKYLKQNKYNHYEVSNYSLPGFESKHNQRYWNQFEYLGLGLGAHSYINKTVWENTRDFNKYIKNPMKIEGKLKHSKLLSRMDYIMLHLRKNTGIKLKSFSQKFSERQMNFLLKKSKTYIESGHIEIKNNKLAATEKGFLILNKITTDLI